MVDEDLQRGKTEVNNDGTDETQVDETKENNNEQDKNQEKNGSDDYGNFGTPFKDDDPALGGIQMEEEPQEDREGIQSERNADQNVLELQVEPDEPPKPDMTSPEMEEKRKEVDGIPRATVIYRSGWGARPPKDPPPPPLKHPIDSVIFMHTGKKAEECHDFLECSQRLQDLQRRNMFDEGMPDIQYNFMVTSDNTIYEGRGWHFSGSKDPMYKHYEGKSLDICFVGDFTGRNPPEGMVHAAVTIIGEGTTQKYMTEIINFLPLNATKPIKVNFAEDFSQEK